MIYYFLIEKRIFDTTVFAFNTVNDYTLQRSDFEFSFLKNDVDYVACLCEEAYINDTFFEKVEPSDLDNWLRPLVKEITPRQFDLQLIEEGLYNSVQALIAQSNLETQIWYNRSTIIKIDNPVLAQFATVLGKDSEFIQDFFNKAINK